MARGQKKREIVLTAAQTRQVIGIMSAFPWTAPGHGGTHRRCVEGRCSSNHGTLDHVQDRAEAATAFVLAAEK